MRDVDLFELGTMTNRSPAMFDRRRRILAETRRMIADAGFDDFSIRDLSARANVSSRTIYNAFGGKDQLIALSIGGYFEDFASRIVLDSDPATFAGALDRQIAVTLRNLAIPNYLHAVAAIYFSPSVPAKVREVLIGIGGHQWSHWLRALRVRRGLEPWVDFEALLVLLSDIQFAQVHNWAVGVFPAQDFFPRTMDAVLTTLMGVTRGEARAEIRTAMADMHQPVPEWSTRVTGIEERLRVFEAG